MLRILNPRLHGALDYALAACFLVLPAALDFQYPAGPLSYIIGLAYAGASLLTKYPLGALKVIAFPVHGLLEAVMAAAWLPMPWVFGFAGDAAARNFYVLAGLGLLALVLLTDYRSSGAQVHRGTERRHAFIDRRQRALAPGPRYPDRREGPRDRRRYAAA